MKKFILSFAFAVFSVSVFAQEIEDEKILLPEMTTTVTGESLVAGKEAVPDFTKLLPESKDAAPLPKLPGVQTGEIYDEPEADFSTAADKQIFAQGLVGFGFPGFFTGDFNIYKNSGANPFSIEFLHESNSGYGKHSVTDGFFDRNTLLKGKKTVTTKNFVFNFSGLYNACAYGLQEKSTKIYDINYQTVSTKDDLTWKIPHGFSLKAGINAEWYNRYEGEISDGSGTAYNQQVNGNVIYFNPDLRFGWSGSGFDIGLTAAYTTEFFTDSEFTEFDEYTYDHINRGDFRLSFIWDNSFIKAGANGGVVIGNETGDANSVLPVFTVLFSGDFIIKGRDLAIDLEGGLSSELETLSAVEKKFLYTSNHFLPAETTDWYGSFKMSIPVGGAVTLDAGTVFRKSASGNGVWEADYNSCDPDFPLYTFRETERKNLASSAAISFAWKIFTVEISWKNNLFDVPVNDYKNVFGANLDFQSEKGNWGFNAGIKENFGDDKDFCPLVNAGTFWKLRDSIRLELTIDDAVKLLLRKDRDYGESGYLKRNGSIKCLAHFFF